MALLKKLLVANRGEIAVRIMRSASQLGIRTVAVYAAAEEGADYVALADEKVCLGDGNLASTFLDIQKIIGIALTTGSAAIHPGYGFLSENSDFARACKENGIIFVGPDAEVLQLMGNKQEAKSLASSLQIPVIPGYRIDSRGDVQGQEPEFPLLVKASYGGGGKGMKIIGSREELEEQVNRSTRMALEYFGNGELFAEPYIRHARHVEVQLLGDHHGNIVHLGERECSVQRHYQKIIEEAPATFLSADLRAKICEAALQLGRAVGYAGAGTVEFLVDGSGNFFFMEMNPRIQVEHAVTEEITGVDLVAEQLKIASGEPLSPEIKEIKFSGHAIEARIYAEDPSNDFRPSARPVQFMNMPEHRGIRIECDPASLRAGTAHFDPLLLKVIARGEDREGALRLLRESLGELNIIGPATNVRYLEKILSHPDFLRERVSTEFCGECHNELAAGDPSLLPWLLGSALETGYPAKPDPARADPWSYRRFWRLTPVTLPIVIDGKIHRITLTGEDHPGRSFILDGAVTMMEKTEEGENYIKLTINGVSRKIFYCPSGPGEISTSCENSQHRISFPGLLKNYAESATRKESGTVHSPDEITSPLHGKILDIRIRENQLVRKGDPLLVIEAMKSENHILAHRDARVKKIAVKVGAQVTDRMPLVYLEEENGQWTMEN